MPWWARILLILLLIVAVVLFLRLNDCHEGLSTCSEDLSKCLDALGKCCDGDDGSNGEPAFKLVLEAESYGTFLPVNNQFPCPSGPDQEDIYPGDPARCRPIHSGFFMQLSTFDGVPHSYSHLLLTFANNTTQVVKETEFDWVDIVCVEDFPDVLTPDMAQMLLPMSADDGRLLHKDMQWNFTNLVTLWQGKLGLSMKMLAVQQYEDPQFQHSHDTFTFTSSEACQVRVWTDLASGELPQVYPEDDDPATRVIRINVREELEPTTHGGVHHPPWN